MKTWTDDLKAAAEPLSSLSSLSEEGIQEAADDATSATETLADSLQSLGRPTRARETRSRPRSRTLTSDLESGVQEIETAVEGISSAADIPTALGTVTTTLGDLGRDVGTALQTIEDADASGELRRRSRTPTPAAS